MGYSSLTAKYIPADPSNYTPRRDKQIEKVTIHHVAGVIGIENLGAIWQRPGRNGSSNYGIGNDGRIACYVKEEHTSWCDSNWDSNSRSITIETSNSAKGGNYPVGDAALNSLINLIADIFRRYNLRAIKGKTITWHRMYTSTNCPGEYLLSKMDYIVSEVNKKLDQGSGNTFNIGDRVIINGNLYSNANADRPNGTANNKVTNITRYAPGTRHPYNTTGDMGWMDAESIRLDKEPPKEDNSKVEELNRIVESKLKEIEVKNNQIEALQNDLKDINYKYEMKSKAFEKEIADNADKEQQLLNANEEINNLKSKIDSLNKELNKKYKLITAKESKDYIVYLNSTDTLYVEKLD